MKGVYQNLWPALGKFIRQKIDTSQKIVFDISWKLSPQTFFFLGKQERHFILTGKLSYMPYYLLNSADPDQPTDLNLHCFPLSM